MTQSVGYCLDGEWVVEEARAIYISETKVRFRPLVGDVVFHIHGPTMVKTYHSEEYYLNGKFHRIGGPAVVNSAAAFYYEHDLMHRTDGPAIVRHDGSVAYFVEGKIPLTIGNLIITNLPMEFDAEWDHTIRYPYSNHRAYRFDDPDELALAILYYS